ncbi:MAG: DUF4783 domain-containing protein [Lewinellaceae bacterium]|nr:DUF4783 domain-containing protein [Saprospiraceae bacterium]MCB9313778.1 DUF4783 domain-containing protein [Lewinellaceae bacterium]HRW74321.1 DUF4783 domain-containing protein [Saprospiraceae bacterium]
MKSLLALFFLSMSTMAIAQTNALQAINSALQRGDAATVASYFDQSVVLDILGDEAIATPAEARNRLEKFFTSHKPAGFKQSHSGSSQGKDSHYMIGELNDGKGSYRVYLYFKTSGGKYTLQELRIDQ